jgi:hypothetical protein
MCVLWLAAARKAEPQFYTHTRRARLQMFEMGLRALLCGNVIYFPFSKHNQCSKKKAAAGLMFSNHKTRLCFLSRQLLWIFSTQGSTVSHGAHHLKTLCVTLVA